MIKKIKSIIYNNKILFENFSFLSFLQISNFLIYMITFPYLIRILGKENYGLVIFAQTIASYFNIFINFGFNISATRNISIYRKDKEKISEMISTVLSIKFFFFLISLLIIYTLTSFIPLLNLHSKVFYFSMIACLSEVLFPIWYFQGIEKMKYITFINISTRIVSVILILFCIKNPSDYFMVPVYFGIGTFSGAITGLFIIFKIYKEKFIVIRIISLIEFVKSNVPLFISNVSSQIYVHSNKLIVGYFLGMQEVAIYDIADKIVNLFKVPFSMVAQTLFPKISRERNAKYVLKVMRFSSLIYLFIYLFIFLFANAIVKVYSGIDSQTTSNLVRVLALSILPIGIGMFFNELILVPFGFFKDYTKMRIVSMFLYIAIFVILFFINKVKLFYIASAIVLVEIFVLIYSIILCKKNKVF